MIFGGICWSARNFSSVSNAIGPKRGLHSTVAFISPATKPSPTTKLPVYEGRVTLDRDYYQVSNTKYPLRYGMTATAEIVGRERRLIDLGLDPFRNLAG